MRITNKAPVIYNSIPDQLKTAANSLTIQEWNAVVNILKTQTNMTTQYLEQLHRLFFSSYATADGTIDFEIPDGWSEEGFVTWISNVINEVKNIDTVHVGTEVPISDHTVVWFQTPGGEDSDTPLDPEIDPTVYTTLSGGLFTTEPSNVILSGIFTESTDIVLSGGTFI